MQAGHNRLRSFVERVERIREEIDALNADVSEVYKEAKSEGWDVKAMKAVIAERQRAAKDPAKFLELNAIIELYRDALSGGTVDATRVRAHDATIPRTSDLSPGDCGHRTEDKGSDEAAPVRVAEGPGTAPVNSSRPAENFEPGALTAAGPDGEGDGAHTPPRTPEPVTSMTSTDHASSGGLHVEGEPDLPAFLDRRGHG